MSRSFLNRLVVPRFVWNFWRFKTTLAGRLLLGTWCLTSLGIISAQVPIYQMFAATGVLLLIAIGTGLVMRPRVAISGRFPRRTSVGEAAVGQFTLTNVARGPAFDLSLGFVDLTRRLQHLDQHVSAAALGPGESVTLPVTIVPRERGLHELPELRAYSTFPFNLFRSGSSRLALAPLLVVPKFHALVELDLPVQVRHQPGGVALTSSVGESPEYIGNREYQPGEPVRRIDFRAWARIGKPVVREYQEEYYCRVAVVLDTHVTPRWTWAGFERWAEGWFFPTEDIPAVYPEVEAAVSLTAAIADALGRSEYLIDLFAAGPELYAFQSGRNVAHFENLLEILACVEACRTNPFATVTPRLAEELGKISTVVCVLLDWDESRRQLCRAIVEAGCSLKRVLVGNRPPQLPVDDPEFGSCTVLTPADVVAGRIELL